MIHPLLVTGRKTPKSTLLPIVCPHVKRTFGPLATPPQAAPARGDCPSRRWPVSVGSWVWWTSTAFRKQRLSQELGQLSPRALQGRKVPKIHREWTSAYAPCTKLAHIRACGRRDRCGSWTGDWQRLGRVCKNLGPIPDLADRLCLACFVHVLCRESSNIMQPRVVRGVDRQPQPLTEAHHQRAPPMIIK
jgi:hypothetical protein